jgi:hypothetical protein
MMVMMVMVVVVACYDESTLDELGILGRHQWPGLARPKQAWLGPASGFEPGQAHH